MSKARYRGLPSIDLDRVVGGLSNTGSVDLRVKAGAMPSEVVRVLRAGLHGSSSLDDADALGGTPHHSSTSSLNDFGSHPVAPSHAPSHSPTTPSHSSSHATNNHSLGGNHSSGNRDSGDIGDSNPHPASVHHSRPAASQARERNDDDRGSVSHGSTSHGSTSSTGFGGQNVPLPQPRPSGIDGTTSHANGSSVNGPTQHFDDGSSLTTFDDGSTLAIGSDGSVHSSPATDGVGLQSHDQSAAINGPTQHFDDGSSLTTFDDGSTLAIGTDGSVHSSPATDGLGAGANAHDTGAVYQGGPTQHFDDGSSLTTYDDGSMLAVGNDGSYHASPATDGGYGAGSHDTGSVYQGGPTQHFDDGSSLTTYDDGSTLAVGNDGSYSSSPATDSGVDAGTHDVAPAPAGPTAYASADDSLPATDDASSQVT